MTAAVQPATRTCADCPAPVEGRIKRCPACHAERERKNRLERVRRHRANKAKGGAAVATIPKDAGPVELYEAGVQALALARSVIEVRDVRGRAKAFAVAAREAKDKELLRAASEIHILAERRLGEMIIAQREDTGLAAGGQPYQASTPHENGGVERVPTLEELGISYNLSSQAQRLAALDDFDARLEQWRAEVAKPGARVTLNLPGLPGGARAPRRPNDPYYTPESIVKVAVAHFRAILPKGEIVWEPCAGDGRMAEALEAAGLKVVRSDIAEGSDFFKVTGATSVVGGRRREILNLCTNPPWGRAREFIDHAFALGIANMCLVLPERFFACEKGREQFERHKPHIWANLSWREDYLERGGSPDRAPAVAIWTSPCANACEFQVWGRGDGDA